METMEAKNIRLTKPQLDSLKKIAEQRGTKVPEIIRRALDEFIDKWKAAGGDR